MLILTIIIFVITACLGAYLLSYWLKRIETPKGVALMHGAFGATGIILLIIYSFSNPYALISLGVFIVAALGGFFIFFCDILGKKIPQVIGIIHGLVAISGLILLITFCYNHL